MHIHDLKLWAPGQVAEGILGFDVATHQPTTSPVWGYINEIAHRGLKLAPNFWPVQSQPCPNVLKPADVFSIMIQYKRSHYFERWNAKQFPHWHCPFYRFGVDSPQQSVLQYLEQAVSGHAVVRYGAPCFHLFDELRLHQRLSNVLAHLKLCSTHASRGT